MYVEGLTCDGLPVELGSPDSSSQWVLLDGVTGFEGFRVSLERACWNSGSREGLTIGPSIAKAGCAVDGCCWNKIGGVVVKRIGSSSLL